MKITAAMKILSSYSRLISENRALRSHNSALAKELADERVALKFAKEIAFLGIQLIEQDDLEGSAGWDTLHCALREVIAEG